MLATLQTIFAIGFTAYAANHNLPRFIHKAAWCIIHCRREILGGHQQVCPEGHFARNHYNSCKHRICPRCAFIQVQKWLAKQKARLLPCDHYHVIFTIPHELNSLWRYNVKKMALILFQCVRDTIFELLADAKYLGGKPGVIASLHTWTKTLQLHPHIHCLITGGGIKESKWLKLKRDFLFPCAVARKLFRGKFLITVSKAIDKGELILPKDMTYSQWRQICKQIWRKKWNVHIREKYTHGKGVLSYLARYLRGGPISNSRIVKIENNQVKFHTGRGEKKLTTLPIEEFIKRFIQHIPHTSLTVVRAYGPYANGRKKELNLCHQLLGGKLIEENIPFAWQEIMADSFAQVDKKETCWLCPICSKPLVVKNIISPFQSTSFSQDASCQTPFPIPI